MKPTLVLDNAKVFLGSCLDVLPTLPDNSVDSVVCDPPYELGFMGKSWDASGIAYNVEVWKQCLRVLKPGGHLLAFGGSRTWHRLAVAIEDAGFEMRDSIAWIYGSGFPKSHNISKAIDKLHGAEREIVGRNPNSREQATKANTLYESGTVGKTDYITEPATDDAKAWDGWGTALKPAFEPIVVARKPLVGTVAENVLQFGTGGINIDASRIGFQSEADQKSAEWGSKGSADGWGLKADAEVLPTNPSGRWPANVIFAHTEDCVQIGTSEEKYSINKLENWSGFGQVERPDFESSEQTVSNPVFECVDGCPVKLLDEQSGIRPGGQFPSKRGQAVNTSFASGQETVGGARSMGDSGGASRFFYVAKASKQDRNEGLDELPTNKVGSYSGNVDGHKLGANPNRADQIGKNFHPTVKPTTLMTYLIKLVTPEAGVVLDPFAGSGSTGKAAILEGYKFVGIELTADYLPIIEGRLQHAYQTYIDKGDDLFA